MRITRAPSERKTSSRGPETLESRSWIRNRAPGSWAEPGRSKEHPDRGGTDSDPELAELSLDAHGAPRRVLSGQTEDQLTDLGIDRWPSWLSDPAVGPLPSYQLPVPSQERL